MDAPIRNRSAAQGLRHACLALLLAGFGNMSGLGGSEHYGCKAPAGVQCQSVSGAYFSGIGGKVRLPSVGGGTRLVQPAAMTRASLAAIGADIASPAGMGGQTYTPAPLRTPARVLRVWIKSWEDADHDLIDQSYVYVRVDHGKWMLDHVQRQVREAYAPLRPPKNGQLEAAAAPTPDQPALPTGAPQSEQARLPGLDAVARGGAMGGR